MTNIPGLKFEQAIRMLIEYLPPSEGNSRKPILFHDVRVGVYLYENGYSEDVVLAGLLHDLLEWSEIDVQLLRNEFGDNVANFVLANTKDDSIENKEEKTEELINRCVQNGEEALVIKSADIIDSFKWYSKQKDNNGLQYCMRNAGAILRLKPDNFDDKIFEELKKWLSA